jgi:hypothetical protein
MRKLKLYISFPTRLPRSIVDCGYFVSKAEGSAQLKHSSVCNLSLYRNNYVDRPWLESGLKPHSAYYRVR